MPPGMPPEGMQPPGLPGIPGEMTGQLTPEMLGIPPGAPPGMFQELMGQPLSEEEMMRRQMGVPPEIMP